MFLVIKPNSWDSLRSLMSDMKGRWVFRGQSNETWGLSTSLERSLVITNNRDKKKIVEQKERLLLREFQRRAHHYIPSPPLKEESLEWLALMQHHGGATRLLDFSHSFYVAMFFAVEEKQTEGQNGAVWAVNLDEVNKAVGERLNPDKKVFRGEAVNRKYIELAQSVMKKGINNNIVFGVEPERMNERLAAQQGLFLFPCNIGVTFEDNLAGIFGEDSRSFQNKPAKEYSPKEHGPRNLARATVIKMIIPNYIREEILHDLWNMNVSSATLFPGFDGFTRSLNYHLLNFL
jgi:hypothetical protein